MGDPRIELDLRDATGRAYAQVPAGNYRFGDQRKKIKIEQPFAVTRYPVTNSQFAPFIEEDGYQQRSWWSEEGWNWRQEQQIAEPALWRSGERLA